MLNHSSANIQAGGLLAIPPALFLYTEYISHLFVLASPVVLLYSHCIYVLVSVCVKSILYRLL